MRISFCRELFTPYFRCRNVDRTKAVDRSAKDLLPHAFVNRQGFPRHNRLVNRGFTAEDRSVNRDRFSGQNTQNISLPDFLCRDHFFFPVL